MADEAQADARPVDTSAIALPRELHALVEILAENTHAVWTRQRLAEGWRLGPERDDAAKLHPSLVRYDRLPGSEREYDRLVVTEVLKVLYALGYRVERP